MIIGDNVLDLIPKNQDRASKVRTMQRLIDEGLASGEARPFYLPAFLNAMATRDETVRQKATSSLVRRDRRL